jgi:hypothetical protein
VVLVKNLKKETPVLCVAQLDELVVVVHICELEKTAK